MLLSITPANKSTQRRLAYLEEQQRRHKVGGILDRRFGENDPSMAPEDKMLERFTREKQLRHNKNSAFDLEEDDGGEELTHMGKSLSLDGPALRDDFEEDDLDISDAEDHPSDEERQTRKRDRVEFEGSEDEGEDEDGEDRPERKKSKQEVMKELIAKSKLHKYERQAVKDDDEDLREELDKELGSIHDLLRGFGPKPVQAIQAIVPGMNADRAAMLSGMDRVNFDKEYDVRMRQMAQDKRSQPTEKSKPDEQIIEERARKLQELEAKRLRRMQGEEESEEEAEKGKRAVSEEVDWDADSDDEFGLGAGIKVRPSNADLGVEDEDDFVLDDDLIASGSDMEETEGGSSNEEEEEEEEEENGESDEFLAGLLTEEESKRPEFLTGANAPLPELKLPEENGVNGDLAYKFSCPESHEELLSITRTINTLDLPTVIQRIRALYHPKLNSENKGKLGNFAVALVDHIDYLANQDQEPPFSVLETTIRHIHSLAKTYPVEIANAFRRHLQEINVSRAMSLTPGDLVILTAVGTVFPTSDHFHQVVTPAMLTMGRYLGLKIPQNLSDLVTGTYLCTLCLQYQSLSKRYVPEVVNFIQNTLHILAPVPLSDLLGNFPYHEPKKPLRIESKASSTRTLRLYDCIAQHLPSDEEEQLKAALLGTNLQLVLSAADTWNDKSAFTEVFQPILVTVQHLSTKQCRSKLTTDIQVS